MLLDPVVVFKGNEPNEKTLWRPIFKAKCNTSDQVETLNMLRYEVGIGCDINCHLWHFFTARRRRLGLLGVFG